MSDILTITKKTEIRNTLSPVIWEQKDLDNYLDKNKERFVTHFNNYGIKSKKDSNVWQISDSFFKPQLGKVTAFVKGYPQELYTEHDSEFNVEETFRQLSLDWHRETEAHSSLSLKYFNKNYQQIIGLGKSVIVFILQELQKEPDFWFWALESITRENPVLQEHFGDIEQMSEDWIIWGKEKNYIK